MTRWGILGLGSIAGAFASGLNASRTGELVASGSRSLEKAQKFADKWDGKPFGSYDEVLASDQVDAVYIALPHHIHAEWTIKAAQAGKAILCEKPFTLDHESAEQALAVVREQGVFFMEAFMYRCSPQINKLRELLADGAIGRPLMANVSFGFNVPKDFKNFRLEAELGGGALMDVGCYCLSLIRLVLGDEPESGTYDIHRTNGYDGYGIGRLAFPDDRMGLFTTAFHLAMKNDARIYGEKGMILVENPWFGRPGDKLTLIRNGEDPEEFSLGCTGEELYAYEADVVGDSLAGGLLDSDQMSIEDTLGNMRAIDMMKASAGLEF
jgi:predicted dehydrogenase